MTSLRPVNLALMATLLVLASGCRTAGVDGLARPSPLPSQVKESATELLVEHNRNAERITSLRAEPSVSLASGRTMGGLSGKLALEMPRNFFLELSTTLQTVANIGSNDEEYWFWTKDSPEKAVYYCNHDQEGTNPLAAGLQPDWIIEALGLRVVSEGEMTGIKVTPGKEAGTILLTERERTRQGNFVVKETILDETTHRIREHWVYAADHKTALAHAVISGYDEYSDPANPSDPEKIFLPKSLRLEWMLQEKMAINVTLKSVMMNPRFPPERRHALFVEPKPKGFGRVNLAELSPTAVASPSGSSPTSVRESLPAPSSPPRVRLNDPAPLGLDSTSAPIDPSNPAALAANMPPSYARGVEEVVGPPIPTIDNPRPETVRTRSGWRYPLGDVLER